MEGAGFNVGSRSWTFGGATHRRGIRGWHKKELGLATALAPPVQVDHNGIRFRYRYGTCIGIGTLCIA